MPEESNARTTVTEYMDYATAHGVGRVKNSPYLLLKVFWVLAVLGSIVVVSIQLSRLADKWKSVVDCEGNDFMLDIVMVIVSIRKSKEMGYPINTKLEIESLHEMRFPAVTVCNMNPLRYSKVQDDYELMSAVQVAASKWGINLNAFEEDDYYNGTSYNVTDEINELTSVTGTGATIENMVEYFRIKAGSADTDTIGNYSHQFDDLMVSCSFNGAACDESQFVRYRSYEFGMCYTFGARDLNVTEDRFFNVHSPGKDHGLKMILNAEQEEYLPFVTDASGFIVTVHHPDKTPYEREEGILVSAGFSTEIAVTVEDKNRIPGPQKRCVIGTSRSLKVCHRHCLEKSIIERCGCTREVSDFVYDDYAADENETITTPGYYYQAEEPVRMCNPQNDTLCILRTKMAQGFGEFKCVDCFAPCRSTKFVTSTSITRWPAETYRPVLEKILDRYSKNSFTVSDVRDNMAQVRIYLPSFTKQILIEEQAYTDENFVSDIGGQFGLWVGFSVLSLLELIELVVLLVGSCCRRKVTPDTTKK